MFNTCFTLQSRIVNIHIKIALSANFWRFINLRSSSSVKANQGRYFFGVVFYTFFIIRTIRQILYKGAVSRGFSSRFVKTSLKLRLNAFTHTQNAPRTPRERYQVNFCKERKP